MKALFINNDGKRIELDVEKRSSDYYRDYSTNLYDFNVLNNKVWEYIQYIRKSEDQEALSQIHLSRNSKSKDFYIN